MEATSNAGCCACATSRSRATAPWRRRALCVACLPPLRRPRSGSTRVLCGFASFVCGRAHTFDAETHTRRKRWRWGVGARCIRRVASRRDVARAASRRDLARAASRRRRVPSARVLCGFASFVCGRAHTFDAETHTRRGGVATRGGGRRRGGTHEAKEEGRRGDVGVAALERGCAAAARPGRVRKRRANSACIRQRL